MTNKPDAATPDSDPSAAFDLAVQQAPAAVPARRRSKPAANPSRPGASGNSGEGTQIIAYRHPDKRKNNPEVGMVTPITDPDDHKNRWAYDPHIDPALAFDSGRAAIETLIDDALESADPATLRAALEELKRRQAPYLNWAGKAERTSFDVDTVSLHVHERIDPASILSAVRKQMQGEHKSKTASKTAINAAIQPGLFDAPFENLPLRDAIDFYRHERGWANRLVAGDSLLVMNSLLQKESMAGRVQMIYIDPPYGIKYGSNFQPFVGKRDVKDRADADLTQEPEMIKAFRDTWELGIHSYLTYLRDRLLLAKELLSESGSVFVQISDENLHHVREIMDEVLGAENFVSQITLRKTSSEGSTLIGSTCDYLIWFAKNKDTVKYLPLYVNRKEEAEGRYDQLSEDGRSYRLDNMTSSRSAGDGDLTAFHWLGRTFDPGKGTFKTTEIGLKRLAAAQRLQVTGKGKLSYIRFSNDFGFGPVANLWSDISGAVQSRSDPKVYVVQTSTPAIERCLLMTTDPGDLVLDITCGSGTTAFVAEKWGRRWITCDTSRVAVTLAKQRLLTASYDYFELRYPHEGLKGGFIYKTVPHVMLKSIANNPEIDEIHARLWPAVEAALAALNAALSAPSFPRRRESSSAVDEPLDSRLRGNDGVGAGNDVVEVRNNGVEGLREWEVLFDFPADWPAAAQAPFDAFHAARQALQRQMDASIAAHADQEILYDQPAVARNKLRITGPFTVEAVPFPSVKSLEDGQHAVGSANTADASIARSGHSGRQHEWRDELLKAGIRGKGGQMLKFAELETLPDCPNLPLSGHLDSGERVVVSFGPEHAALEQRQVANALNEAGNLFPLPKMIIFCAFAFDPEAAKDIDCLKGITALKAQMNIDLLTEDLKKARASNQSFWLMGQPDVEVRALKDGRFEVEVNGFDYFDTVHGELVSGGKSRIALWALDTDYDERSLFPRQVFFPMAGKGEGWEKLKKTIRAELNEDLLAQFHGTVSLPFAAGDNRKIAVKIVDDRGIESLKVMVLAGSQPC